MKYLPYLSNGLFVLSAILFAMAGNWAAMLLSIMLLTMSCILYEEHSETTILERKQKLLIERQQKLINELKDEGFKLKGQEKCKECGK